jgi:acetolactate synthase-1/3 small subunit
VFRANRGRYHRFIFELTGAPDKIDTFVALMKELGLVEAGRTGIVGMIRGAQAA